MGNWSSTNSDNYLVNGGFLNENANSYNYFASITMTGGTIAGSTLMAGVQSAAGVNVVATPGGALISSNFWPINQGGDALTFNVAHNGSAPYDLLLTGAITDLNSVLSGEPLIKSGPGLLAMSGANAYVGPTIVAAGTLQIGNGGSGETLSSGSIGVSSGAVLAFNQADTLTISPSAGISGGGALVKFGGGTVVLASTNNAYAGGTTVNAGVLTFTNSGAVPGFPSTINISASSGATVAVSMSGWSQGDIDSLRTSASIPAGAYFGLDTTGGNATYASSISAIGSGAGAGGLAKVGANTLTLTNTGNSYTGGTLLIGGTLDFANGALPLSGIAFNGGTLQWAIGNSEDVSAGLAAIPSGQTARFDTNGNNVAFAAGVTGGGGLRKLGGGADPCRQQHV